MLILAIDPGTHMGYAFAHVYNGKPQLPQSGVVDLRPRRFEGGGMRFLRVERWLDDVAPHEVYFEEVRGHKGTSAAHIYGGIVGVLTAWCEANNVPYQGVPVGTIKKHATGKGNAGKPAMIEAARERYAYHGDDDNEADALHLLDYALTELIGVKEV